MGIATNATAAFLQHENDVKKLSKEVRRQKELQATTAFTLAKSTLQSNTTRSPEYKKNTNKLSLDAFNRVLAIDPEQMIAIAEPGVTMEALAKATLEYDLIPLVIPEFKGITVGGAIVGCGGESSSHKYGLFHDICISLEVLIGDGSVLKVSREEYSDLFYGITGSYGSLGVVLSAEIKLQKALPFVELTMQRFSSASVALEKMKDLMCRNTSPEYLDGIIFSDTDAVILRASQVSEALYPMYKDELFSPWFYQHVQSHKASQNITFSIPLVDYLFRYDRGAFWMGSYVLNATILRKLLLEGISKVLPIKPFTKQERLRLSKLKDPNWLLKALAYSFTTSQRLFGLLHSCEDWVKQHVVVQDFTLPVNTVATFLDTIREFLPIYPLWLCPLKKAESNQIFAPNSLNGSDSINIGVYGIPSNFLPLDEALRKVEESVSSLNGRKWLYTHSHYTQDEFWQIYPKADYQALRKKYHAEGAWLSIENKVLS